MLSINEMQEWEAIEDIGGELKGSRKCGLLNLNRG